MFLGSKAQRQRLHEVATGGGIVEVQRDAATMRLPRGCLHHAHLAIRAQLDPRGQLVRVVECTRSARVAVRLRPEQVGREAVVESVAR